MRSLVALIVVLVVGSVAVAAPPQAPVVPQAPRTVLVACVCGEDKCTCPAGTCPGKCPVAKAAAAPVKAAPQTKSVAVVKGSSCGSGCSGCASSTAGGSCQVPALTAKSSVSGGCANGSCGTTSKGGLFRRRG